MQWLRQAARPGWWHRRRVALGLGLLLGVAGLVLTGLWGRDAGPPQGIGLSAATATYRVERQPITVALSFVGRVEPSRTVSITAPFDGIVTAKKFSYGARVNAGDLLFDIDTDALDVKLLEAQSALLRATQTARSFDDWASGPEATRARRAVDDARAALQDSERQVAEVGQLLERGLVPRVEHDGLVQQLRGQRTSLASAESELEQILARGQGEERQIARLEAELARRRVDELNRLRARSAIRAPMDGVALFVPPSGGANGTAGKTGTVQGDRVAQGDTLLAIADPGSFAVTGAVDEADINRLHPGQPAEVRVVGSNAVIQAEVATLSEQGIERGAAIVYPVTVRLLVPPDTASGQIKIGMTADISVRTYANPAAIAIPPSALDHNAKTVMRLNPATGAFTAVPVTIGHTTFNMVEILSGVDAGDIVALFPAR